MPSSPWTRLSRRVEAMHQLWEHSVRDLTIGQINHVERAGVLPIAFTLLHYVKGEDRTSSTYLHNEPTLWETGKWPERIGGNLPDIRRGTSIEVAERALIENAAQWMNYQRAVFAQTEAAMRVLPDSSYDSIKHDSVPEHLQGSFVSNISDPDGPILLGDLIEGFVFQHGIRHLGELDHSRALLGLQGVT